MPVPYTFGSATSSIPLSQLDSNFATAITIGNTAVQLGNTVTTLNNMTLANVTISSGNVTLTNVSVTTANATTANITNSIITTGETLSYGTANGVAYLNTSKVLTTGSSFVFDGTNVGIGTSSPADILNVVLSSASLGGMRLQNTNASGQSAVSYYNNAGTQKADIWWNNNGSVLNFRTLSTDPMVFSTNNSERMRIDSSGNVGIGTTSPGYKLDVRSTLAVLDGSSNIGFYANGTTYTQIWQTLQSPNDFIIQTTASKYISFGINSSEKARIDTSGNLLLGVTSSPLLSSMVLYFDGASKQGLLIKNTANSASGAAVRFMDYLGNVSGGGIFYTSSNAITYATSSDYRLKENIQPMTGALEKVAQLKPCTFKWTIDGSSGQGFIAHELQAVIPEAVVGEKNGTQTYTDEEGNEQTRPVYQGIDTSFLVATLTAAIQEQQAIITALTSRIEALEGIKK